MRAARVALLAVVLSGCAYNDPARFAGRLTPHELSLIEPPPENDCPQCPMLKGQDYSHVYTRSATGPTYGTWHR